MTAEPFATPTNAQPSPGLAAGEGHFYSDGFRPGDFKFCYGVLADLLARNPGWHLADGAVALQDGSIPPDLRDRFIIGAGLTYPLGAAGGSAGAAAHTHAFTQATAHGTHTPTNNHSGAAVTAHGVNATEVTPLGGSGVFAATQNSAANLAAAMTHNVTQPSAHAAMDHTNNHTGGAVGAVTGGGTDLPPYAALYILVKVS